MHRHALSAFWLAFVHLSTTAIASPLLEVRASNSSTVCSSGIYAELGPYLSSYQPALAFCQAVFPVKCTTPAGTTGSTTTTTSGTTGPSQVPSSTTTTSDTTTTGSVTTTTDASTTTTTDSTDSSTTTDPSSTTTTDDSSNTSASQPPPAVSKRASPGMKYDSGAQPSAWSMGQKQNPRVFSTLCSCIVTPTACPVNNATRTSAPSRITPISSGTSTSTSSTTRPTCVANRNELAIERCSRTSRCTLAVQQCQVFRDGRDACFNANRSLLQQGNATAIGYFYNSQNCVVYGPDCCAKNKRAIFAGLGSLIGSPSGGAVSNMQASDGGLVAIKSDKTIQFGQ